MNIDDVMKDLVRRLKSNDPEVYKEIRQNTKDLHEAESFSEFLDFICECIESRPDEGHSLCIAVQAGYHLGLRAAHKKVQ